MSPEVVKCGRCGEVLFASSRKLQSVVDVALRWNGKCPGCGRRLDEDRARYEVRVAKKSHAGLFSKKSEPPKSGKSRRRSFDLNKLLDLVTKN